MSVPERSGSIGQAGDCVLWKMVPGTGHKLGEGAAVFNLPPGSDRQR